MRAPGDYPDGKQGDVLTVEFAVIGIPCVGLNGGPEFKHNEAFSFQIATDDQDDDVEEDRHHHDRGGATGLTSCPHVDNWAGENANASDVNISWRPVGRAGPLCSSGCKP